MKTLLVAGITGATALVLGMGVGGAVMAGETIEVPGETKTVTKEVEVPGPTVTKEVEVEVPVTPRACLQALKHAEKIGVHAGDFADIAAGYLPLISLAYDAGVNMMPNVDHITDQMERQNNKLEALNDDVLVTADAYNSAAAECRASK